MRSEPDERMDLEPPLFLRLSREGRRLDVLMHPTDHGQQALCGSWWCEVTAPGGQRIARPMEFGDGTSVAEHYALAARAFGDDVDTFDLWDSPEGASSGSEEVLEPLSSRVCDGAETMGRHFDDMDFPFPALGVDAPEGSVRGDGARRFGQVVAGGHSSVAAIDPGEPSVIETTQGPDGPVRTPRAMPRRDFVEAYRLFIRHGHHEAARAVGTRMLATLAAADDREGSDPRSLVAAADATLRFPDLREQEGPLGEILDSRSSELVDLMALAWARRFDSDPAPDAVFEEELDTLVQSLALAPPAYSGTVRSLLQRLGTAIDVWEAVNDKRHDVARAVLDALGKLADAVFRDRDENVFEGWTLLATERTNRSGVHVRTHGRSYPSPGFTGG